MPIHVVKSGETIYSIAQLYDISTDRIVYDNELDVRTKSCSGSSSFDSDAESVHIVREGQTVEQIAEEYSITVKNLYQNNPFLLNQTHLLEGQSLVISYEGEPLMQGRISAGMHIRLLSRIFCVRYFFI